MPALRALTALGFLLAALLAAEAATADPTTRLSRKHITLSGHWRDFVLDHSSPYVYPVGVEVQDNVPVAGEPGEANDLAGMSSPGGVATTITATGKGSPTLVVDLGKLTGGRVQISVTSNSGTTLRLAYSEALRFLTPEGDINHGSQGRNDDPSNRWDILPDAPGEYTLPGIRGSQRYILIRTEDPGTVQIDYLRIAVNHLRPRQRHYVGHFLSSDHLLNRIWYAGAYTLNLDTYGDPLRGGRQAVTDGAKHDRLVWLGDVPIEYLAGIYTVRQMPAILRRTIQLFTCQQEKGGFIPAVSDTHVHCRTPGPANGPPPAADGTCTCVTQLRLPEYTAWFVIAAAMHYRYTADPRVEEWLPVVRRAIGYFNRRVGTTGLFLTDAHELNWHPPDFAGGEDAHANTVWVRALREAAYLEKRIGSPGRGRSYRRRARRLAAAILARFYDPSVGALRQNPINSTGNHTQDANVGAVLAGVLGGAGAEAALDFLQNRLWTPFGTATGEFDDDTFMGRYISPFMSSWEVIARFQIGRADSALELTRREWGRMIDVDPANSVWEKMTVDGGVAPYSAAPEDGSPITESQLSGETSLAHGWGAGPTMALSAYVLGLRPVGAGWSSWLIEPQVGDLEWAQGTVGTPHGRLGSRWRRDPDRPSFRLTVRVPGGTEGTVAVPLLGNKRTIARDGQVVWKGKRPARGVRASSSHGYVRFHEEDRGLHTYAWAKR
jgi:alpha-L-rhamnosidase